MVVHKLPFLLQKVQKMDLVKEKMIPVVKVTGRREAWWPREEELLPLWRSTDTNKVNH